MTIMKATVTQSASGSSTLTWTDDLSIMARAQSLNFTKEVIANKATGARFIRVTTWYLEELTGMQSELGQTYRLKRSRNGRDYYYEISSVEEIQGEGLTYMFTELNCELIEQRIVEEEAEGVFDSTFDSTFG